MVVVILSLPSRERGLKYRFTYGLKETGKVAPFTGAWIEIPRRRPAFILHASLPSRERGLKLELASFKYMNATRRSLHGSVD